MVVVVVHHHIKPGRAEDAERSMESTGALMAKQEGFLFRYSLTTKNDPLDRWTYSGWQSEKHMLAWNAARGALRTAPPVGSPESPYASATNDQHEVTRLVLPNDMRTGERLNCAIVATDIGERAAAR